MVLNVLNININDMKKEDKEFVETIEKAAREYQQYIESNNPQADAWDFYGAFIAGATWVRKHHNMVRYIDKADVVAEINRVLSSYDPNEITSGRYALIGLRDFLDTLEAKEEVTTTNAFIEKACEWMKNNKEHPLIGCEDTGLSGFLTEEFIAEFRKAMEGE